MIPEGGPVSNDRRRRSDDSSDVADAAVDDQVGARHERTLIRGEEEGGVGEFVGMRESRHEGVY